MNAFVCGNIEEVKGLGTILLNAAETAEYGIIGDKEGTDIKIKYNDGRIEISYEPIETIDKWKSED